MKNRISKIWFPTVLIGLAAVQSFGIDAGRFSRTYARQDSAVADTVVVADSSELADSSSLPDSIAAADSATVIVPPDSLRISDPVRYKFYVAMKDTTVRAAYRDSLRSSNDSLSLHILDSLVYADSTETARLDSIARIAAMSRKERKKYFAELKTAAKLVEIDSILHRKDSLRAIKDSITENTPRILSTYAIPDSMQYKRMIAWNHTRDFNDVRLKDIDTSYNYYFQDYPFLREDVNSTYLGVSGSPVETYDFFRREKERNAFFYTPYLVYNYTPESLPMYNTKTPYTELAYWGTLFANTEKEETDVRVMTSQNILPELNITLEYDRFGGNGLLKNEDTDNRTFVASTNYLGKRYLMHAGYIYNRIEKSENGGIVENYWIRDTTVDAREIDVHLSDASNRIKKNTIFLDQSYRIPFSFLERLKKENRMARKAEKAIRDSIMATGDSAAISEYLEAAAERELERTNADTIDNNVTTAFIGHCSEYSVFTKSYKDNIGLKDTVGRNFYDGNFYLNPLSSADSMRVMKFDNRIFIRLQPWSSDGIISKLDVGIGDKLLNYYDFDRTSYITKGSNVSRNSVYLYAGAQGQLKKYIRWNATGNYTFLGSELNDFGIDADMVINLYPFRRHKDSPMSLNLHFETTLQEPDYYAQHLHSNHYWWDNEFGKISETKAVASLDIPVWNLNASFGYALLGNNLYYDQNAIIRQNGTPMSVMTGALTKNFRLWKFHFDNMALLQFSSNEDVMPLPKLALNLRYYFQFDVVKDVMQMQLGANATYTTKWYAPAYSPALGVFHNQKEELYGNCPYIDVFLNIQWKRACIFVKAVNLGMGWPNKSADYFSAHHYIRPQQTFKFGMFWPFYVQPRRVSNFGETNQGLRSSGK